MTDVNKLLQELGFTDYEARAYVALLQQSPLNGYELAKVSGIPRPNIYKVLQKLEERNIVVRADTPNSAVYTPIPQAELTRRLGNRFKKALSAASRALDTISKPANRDYVWNIDGYDTVLDHARTLIDQAQDHIIVAVWQPETGHLSDAITNALGRNTAVQTLCLQACPQECGDCHGVIYRYPIISSQQSRWLIVVQDGIEMIMADIHNNRQDGSVSAVGTRTRQQYMSQLASWYIRHSIALTSILRDTDNTRPSMLSPETRDVLQSLGPGVNGWLENMRQLLDQ